jgi:CRP-like cAMP-binding protein
MHTEAAVALLRRTRLFAELREDTLRALADRSVERSYPRHGRLFYQGDPGSGLYVLASGLVKVVVTSENGEEMVLVTLGPGDAFGELSIVDGGPRSASAEALEPTVALVITREVLLDLATRDSGLTEALLRTLGALLRRLTEQASDLVFLDLPGRSGPWRSSWQVWSPWGRPAAAGATSRPRPGRSRRGRRPAPPVPPGRRRRSWRPGRWSRAPTRR